MQAPTIHIMLDESNIPRTINGGVKVSMIALKFNASESAEDIATHYGITVADVYAAMAYFHDNRAYFDARDRDIQPVLDDARKYTAELNARIRDRLQQQSESDD